MNRSTNIYLERNVGKSFDSIILVLEANDFPKAINSNFESGSRLQIWQLPFIWIAPYRLFQFFIATPFSPNFIYTLHKYTYNLPNPNKVKCNCKSILKTVTLKLTKTKTQKTKNRNKQTRQRQKQRHS